MIDLIDLQLKGVYTIPNFLTTEECLAYQHLTKNPPLESSNFTTTGVFGNRKWVDSKLSESFYQRFSQHVKPSPLAIRPNNLVMTGNYQSGQQFNLHTDTGLFYDRQTREKSRWTMLIYLNDNFEGGHTLFYDDGWRLTHDIKPEMGTALIFDIDLWHKGDVIKAGQKYWIGCEIIGGF